MPTNRLGGRIGVAFLGVRAGMLAKSSWLSYVSTEIPPGRSITNPISRLGGRQVGSWPASAGAIARR